MITLRPKETGLPCGDYIAGLAAVVQRTSVGIDLPLAELYEGMTFPAQFAE